MNIPTVQADINNKIKLELTNKNMWLCVDETANVKNISIVNVIVAHCTLFVHRITMYRRRIMLLMVHCVGPALKEMSKNLLHMKRIGFTNYQICFNSVDDGWESSFVRHAIQCNSHLSSSTVSDQMK